MARRQSDLDIEIEELTRGWISVDHDNDPREWEAWRDWRRRNMRARFEPKAFTVPTAFPPITVSAATQYLEVMKKIRLSIGWNSGLKLLSKDPLAFNSPASAVHHEMGMA